MSEAAAHWDGLYATRDERTLGWYEPVPATLDAVLDAAPGRSTSILDVGAGTSRLVEQLLNLGYSDLTLLDVSESSLQATRRRLESRADQVEYVAADITSFVPTRQWELWHDRALFHFLVDPAQRAAYRRALRRSLARDGRAVICTFSLEGPDQCAGLPVVRYDDETLATELADELDCLDCRPHVPGEGDGDSRPYVICTFARRPDLWEPGSLEAEDRTPRPGPRPAAC